MHAGQQPRQLQARRAIRRIALEDLAQRPERRFLAAGGDVELRAQAQQLGRLRMALGEALELGQRLRAAAEAREQRRAVERGRQQVGFQLERRGVGGERLLRAPLLAERVAEVELRLGVARRELQGLAVGFLGALQIVAALSSRSRSSRPARVTAPCRTAAATSRAGSGAAPARAAGSGT
jgi:hypothetical protein